MILEIEKRIVFRIDTADERERIEDAFGDDPTAKSKLLELMDAVERQDWAGAAAQLDSEWWQGRDEEGEYPRLEYAGMINARNPAIDSWATYDQLIAWLARSPEVFRVLETEKSKRENDAEDY